jgi:hypothetical protein
MTNLVYLAANDSTRNDAKTLAQDLSEPVQRLGVLVGKLLATSTLPR